MAPWRMGIVMDKLSDDPQSCSTRVMNSQRVLTRFRSASAASMWSAVVKDLAAFSERAKEARHVDLSSPRGKELLNAFAFRRQETSPTEPQGLFNTWFEQCFPLGEVSDPDSLRPDGATCLAVARGEQKPEVFYRLLDAYEKGIQRVLDATAPESFSYSGFAVENSYHMGDKTCRALLEGVDYITGLFKQRGMTKLLAKSLQYIVLRPNQAGEKGVAYYHSQVREITLTTSAISGGGRFNLKWVNEVFLHEFGHFVHMTYIPKDAMAVWDGEWDDVKAKKKLFEEAVQLITHKERVDFFDLLMAAHWNTVAVGKKLKGAQKVKFGVWLRSPMTGDPLITDKQFRLTKSGERVAKFFTDPATFLIDEGFEMKDIVEQATKQTRRFQDKLGLLDGSNHGIPAALVEELTKADPEMSKAVEEAVAKIQAVSDYGATDEREDFAESFVAFLGDPAKLTPNAKFRMQRTLSLAGLYGKPVMRLALRVAERYLSCRAERS